MSFMYVPALLRIPEVPSFAPPEGIWRGVGRDAGLFAFKAGNASWGYYVMTEGSFTYSLVIDGRELTPQYSTINGYIWWSGGSGYVYYSMTYGWVYMPGKFAGYEPIEENFHYDEDTGEPSAEGDEFYSFTSPPYNSDTEVELFGRGSNYGKESKSMTAKWKRWTSNAECGVYEAQDGASGEKLLGLPRFRSNGYEYFTRSFAKTKGHYTYGRIKYSETYGKWVIGEVGSGAGWHEGEEPKVGGSVTFKFCKNEDSEAEGNDITVSYVNHVKGDERTKAYLGEVAIWR